MKKYIFPAILVAALTTACNLDIAPQNTMVDETVYKNESTAEAALLGVYNRFNAAISGAPEGENNYSTFGYPFVYAEVGTPTLKSRVNGYPTMETSDYTSDDHSGFIRYAWRYLYNAIDYANNVIQNVAKFGTYGEAKKNQHIAEAKFLRAYCDLTLLQMYGDGALTNNMTGDGILLHTTSFQGFDINNQESRSSVEQCWEAIINDLKSALNYLPDASATTLASRTRATKTAAYALLSRVYLYRGSYAENRNDLRMAGLYADSVLNVADARGYTFFTTSAGYKEMFPENIKPTSSGSSEPNPDSYAREVILLEPSYSSTALYPNAMGNLYYRKNSTYVDPTFIAKYDAGDVRGTYDGTKGLIYQGSSSENANDKTSAKYTNSDGYNNVLYIRLAEVKLTKAEVEARLNGINAVSLKHLTDVHARAYATRPADYTTGDFASASDLITAILTERMKELAYEGHTRYDFIRTKRALRVADLNDNKKNLPIPNYDINISGGKLVQNSGYR